MVNEMWNASNPWDIYINGQFRFASARRPFITDFVESAAIVPGYFWFSTITVILRYPILTSQFIFRFVPLADPNLTLANRSAYAGNNILIKKP